MLLLFNCILICERLQFVYDALDVIVGIFYWGNFECSPQLFQHIGAANNDDVVGVLWYFLQSASFGKYDVGHEF